MRLRWLPLLLVGQLIVSALPAHASVPTVAPGPSDSADPMWVTNGSVNAVVRTANKILIGGSFSYVGPPTGSFVKLDGTSAAPDASFPIVDGRVSAQTPDGSGGWFIGGDFLTVGGHDIPRLAHIFVTGSVDTTFVPAPDRAVLALAYDLANNALYAGGEFSSIGGAASRANLARLNGTTGADLGWDPAPDSSVEGLTLGGSTLYAAGNFTQIGGETRNHVAAFDTTTNSNTPTAWDPDATPGGFVNSLAVDGSNVYLAGAFTQIGDVPRSNLAKVDGVTGDPLPWRPDPNDYVNDVVVSGSTVYASGSFTQIGGEFRNRLAALDATTGDATSWDPAPDDFVSAITVDATTVYAVGDFTHAGGQTRNFIAALDATTGAATAWNPDPDASGISVGVASGAVFVGGVFNSVGGQAVHGLAALDPATGAAIAGWDAQMNGFVDALTLEGNTLYVAGSFGQLGGQPRQCVGAIDISTTPPLATGWHPSGCNQGGISAMVVGSDAVYVAGDFTGLAGTTSRRNAMAFDKTTGDALPWAPQPDGTVSAMTKNGNVLYLGGSFTFVRGAKRPNLAAVAATTGAPTTWNPKPDGPVAALALWDKTLYVGGGFGKIGGQLRANIAALDARSGVPTPWNPGADSFVASLRVVDPFVYAGGGFSFVNGVPRARAAIIDRSTADVLPWHPDVANGTVKAIDVLDRSVVLGGTFLDVDGSPHQGVASFDALAAPTYQGDAKIALEPDPYFTGNDRYGDDGTYQTVTAKIARGKTATFDLAFENDGQNPDSYTIKGCGSSSGFSVSYFDGATDVTSAVVAGSASTGSLNNGDAYSLVMKIKVKSSGPLKDSCSVVLTPTTGPASAGDTVLGIVKVKT